MANILSSITMLILVSFMLIIGVSVYSQFSSSVDKSDFSTAANTSITKIDTQTYNAFNLGSLLPYVLVAVAIIGVLIAAFSFGGRVE